MTCEELGNTNDLSLVCVLVFFVWGLGFFMRLFCFVLFHKNGNMRITPKKQADSRQFDQFWLYHGRVLSAIGYWGL